MEGRMYVFSQTITVRALSFEELDGQARALIVAAANARMRAQAPYSDYLVGTALADERGKIFIGCNVERCSYTQTTHAEQSAIDSMVVGGGKRVRVLATIAGLRGAFSGMPNMIHHQDPVGVIEKMPVPCGHCLQIIWENCGGYPDVKLYAWMNGWIYATTIGDAFPMRFGPQILGVHI